MAERMSLHCKGNYPLQLGLKAAMLLLLFSATDVLSSQLLVPKRVDAVLGKNITLGCRVQVESNLSLTQSTWERKRGASTVTVAVYHPQFGISIAPEYERRLSFRSPSTHDATVTLQDVGFADSGIYTCKVATFPLGNTQASTTVSVMVEPKVYVSAGSVALLDGGNETLVATCTAERARPPAEVLWESGLSGRSETRVTDEPNGTTTTQVRYTWQPSRHAQGHALTCVVRHPALHSHFRIPYLLNVQAAPEIVLEGYHGNWFVGQENVQLQCRADANPPPYYFTWTRLGGQIPEGVEVVNSTLVFGRPLLRNDSGVYRCEVGNDIGLRTRDLDIRIQDPSQKQASLVAVAGAVIGAILALFLITVFTIVILMACRSQPPTYSDKVIDLPPTHKPPPPYTISPPAIPLAINHPPVTKQIPQARWVDRRDEMSERAPVRGAPRRSPRNLTHEPLSYHSWTCHHKGADRVYINHREHYV